jgi:peptidyl-prolyl cis-trans isomerase D
MPQYFLEKAFMSKEITPKIVTKKHLDRIHKERKQKRILLIGLIIVGVLIVGTIIYGFIDQKFIQPGQPVANIGTQSISLKDFQSEVRFTRYQLIQRYISTNQLAQLFGSDPNTSASLNQSLQQIQTQLSPESAPQLGAQVLDQAIDKNVIAQEAQKLNLSVTEDEIETYVQSIFNFFPNGTPTSTATFAAAATSTLSSQQLAIIATLPPQVTGTPEGQAVTETPQSATTPTAEGVTEPSIAIGQATPFPTATPYTLEGYQGQFKDYILELNKGQITEKDLRSAVRDDLLRQKLFDAVTKDVSSEEEQVWARHILVTDENLAKQVIQRLNKGENFATIAAEVSVDSSNKDNGGDLGWFGKGKMVKEFGDAAFAMKTGALSADPVKTQFGYHIIQVIAHENRPLSANEYQSTRQQFFTKWLGEIKATYTINKFDIWQNKIPLEPTLPANPGQ